MSNIEGVRDAIANAEPVSLAKKRVEKAGAKSRQRGGATGPGAALRVPEQWDGLGLPDGCPVRAVGLQKTTCIFLDALGQLIEAGPRELGQAHLSIYFAGDIDYLARWWPYWNAGGVWIESKFTPEKVQRSIQRACAEAGVWNDMNRVRGRGAWRCSDGSLLLNCGDVLVVEGEVMQPDVYDGAVYPAGAPIMRPLARGSLILPAHHENSAGPTLLRMFKTWNWRRGALDARLYLGALVCGFLGGALHWRPSLWVTGESGSGKTTLQTLRRDIAGGWSLNAEDASSSGIATFLGFDAIGVSLDEQENSQDNRKLMQMVELMRLSASGSLKIRGSSNHSGHAFSSRNSFIASSINPAPLKGQDMSRMARLELDVLPKSAAVPRWTRAEAARWGAELLRRCMDQWKRFDDTLAEYQEDLRGLGHDQRGQDTFGVLLACADLVLGEECLLTKGWDPDRDAIWDALDVKAMPEYADKMLSHQAALQHLLTSRPRDWKTPGPGSIGGALAAFMRARSEGAHRRGEEGHLDHINALLAHAGLAVHVARDGPFEGRWSLHVPNQHVALSPLFEQTDFRSEASTVGGWIGALKRAPPGVVWCSPKDNRYRIDGMQLRGVLVNIERAVSWDDPDPDASAPPDATI